LIIYHPCPLSLHQCASPPGRILLPSIWLSLVKVVNLCVSSLCRQGLLRLASLCSTFQFLQEKQLFGCLFLFWGDCYGRAGQLSFLISTLDGKAEVWDNKYFFKYWGIIYFRTVISQMTIQIWGHIKNIPWHVRFCHTQVLIETVWDEIFNTNRVIHTILPT
jgi:hypothetical protein